MKVVRSLVIGMGLLGLALGLLSCAIFNKAPFARFVRIPSSGPAPLAVRFDASSSTDSDGAIVRYAWAFGDGETAEGRNVEHTYVEPSLYEAVLVVTDGQEARAAAARLVEVIDPTAPPEVGPEVGQVAPAFDLADLDGQGVSLLDFRGEVVLLDFWSTTCTSCRTTLPWLEELRARHADHGLVLVGICVDGDADAAQALLEEIGCEMLALLGSPDDAEAVKALYRVDAIPRTFLIDREGVVRFADHPIRLRDRSIEPWL